MHTPALRVIALLGSALAVLLPTPAHAAPEDCLENGGQAQCIPAVPTPTEWQHNLCDDMAAYVHRSATWCSVLGGTWQGNYAPCPGEDTHIVEAEVFPYAEAFERQIHNVQGCAIQGDDRGWLLPGQSVSSWNCWSGGPTFQNGIEVSNLREILFSGQGIDIYTQSCSRNWQERVMALRTRSIQPGCPAEFSLRTNAAGQSECYQLSACQVSLVGLPADVEPGAQLTGLVAAVTCGGQAQTGIPVALESEVIPLSGGHGHDDPQRPKGGVPATVLSGSAFAFAAPIVAGDHKIKATCVQGDCGGVEGAVWVGVRGLVAIPEFIGVALFERSGKRIGTTVSHPSNHYLMPSAIQKLAAIAERLQAMAYLMPWPTQERLHINDASLERGGIFDIRNTWRPKHFEHRRGTVIDLRANLSPGAVNEANFSVFERLAKSKGADAKIHCDLGPGPLRTCEISTRHYHIRLLGRSE